MHDLDYKIFAKVRLADLLYVPSRTNNRVSYYNRIQSKHVDFVICDIKYLKPVLVIELDDSTHNRQDRSERDEFVNKALTCSNLPVLRVPAQYTYNVTDIESKIFNLLNLVRNDISSNEIAVTKATVNESLSEHNCIKHLDSALLTNECFTGKVPICPKCNIPMIKRTTKTKNSSPECFWGCTNFPKCREVVQFDTNL
jgi:very-short-patch-repair endonuclease